ncbi:DUF6443 domain-containing protein [Mucilaginibacter gotjawali]|uniref:Uncharacterized protein n=2 Tax=Mucilaginibacter gotjawali TaxID=1550579 RepID=A0A0X8X389_9SPHI|nr:DUF6443 domain-containing protein [Mucilaginibacter gotjawali]MBB3059156.1 RHS repeat-associated protein [Mucilaginibacter gotjawali]BAU54915.1 hypothetical protein MgSA37_03094 [Mucilaginibacter gotjawali]
MKTNLNRKTNTYHMYPGITKYIFLTVAVALISFKLQAQSPGYVQQDVIKVAGVSTDAQINALPLGSIQTTRVFIDGLGRSIQTVALQASPVNNNDMVAPQAYNTLGQQTAGYLPYTDNSAINPSGSFRTTAIADQLSYYANSGTTSNPNKVANETTYPFSQQLFENSPLQRVQFAGMTGTGFQPQLSGNHYKSVTYRLNNATQDGNILIWSLNDTYTSVNYYADNALYVTDGIDEDGVETLAFADAAGHTVLKRQKNSGVNIDTYYVYNVGGLISYIIPPLALAKMSTAPADYNPNDAPVSTMVFKFVYDAMGRLIEKTVPAKGKMSIVYDPFNRPVLMQDALMNTNHQWNYIRYDAKGRAVSQGIYTDANVNRLTRSAMQTYVSSLPYANYYELRNATQSTGYYSVRVFPSANITPLAYAYFDDYKLATSATAFTYVSQGLTNEEAATTAPVKGMPTMVRKTTVGAALSGDWLLSVTFYDKRLNPIQTQSNNQLYYKLDTLSDYKTTVPDFMGVPQTSYVKKVTSASTTTTVQTNLTYDYFYRVKTISQSYNGGATVTIAAYTYNEMGQLVLKNLGLVSGTTYLQNLDMRYNIRGMLTSINNSTLTVNALTNGETTDVFGMTILYDQSDSNLGNTGKFDGKISAVKWMSKDASGANSNERAYVYSYDQLNRYTGAVYSERNTPGTGSFATNVGAYNETIGATGYDVNGNILSLTRNSLVSGAVTEIDHLAYTYNTTANPNQLQSISETNDANHNSYGFKYIAASTGNYSYDVNGNLTADPYKGITSISYNYLNKTSQVMLSATQYINYTYDASGNLIHKEAYKSGSATIVTDYIDGFVFNNTSGSTALAYFAAPEGRVLNNGSGGFTNEYIITDPQGNARISFNNTGTGGTAKVIQENSYYPTGLTFANSPVSLPTTPNKNLYNGGSEWQNDYSNLPDYYQTFYRNYDAAIARWVAVDPVAESAESMTSYQYAGDNPVMKNDPMGDLIPNEYADPSYSPSRHAAGGFGGGGSWGMWALYNDDQTGMSYEAEASAAVVVRDYGSGGGGFGSTEDLLASIDYIDSHSQYGGHSSGLGSESLFTSDKDVLTAGAGYLDRFNAWGTQGFAANYASAVFAYDISRPTGAPVINTEQSHFLQVTHFYHYTDGSAYTVDGNSATGMIYDASDPEGTAFQNGLLQKSINANADPIDHAEDVFRTIGEADGGIAIAKGLRKMNGLAESGVLKTLGDVTGVAGAVNSMRKGYNEWHTNKALSVLHWGEALGQGLFMVFGGEEFELGFNLTVMAFDTGVDYYEHGHNNGGE